MTLGAQPNKIKLLIVLAVVAVVALYMNVFSGNSDSPPPAPQRPPVLADPVNKKRPPALADPVNQAPEAEGPSVNSRRASRNASSGEIKFRQGAARPEDRPDPATIDPTLRLDLLAKVQNVEPQAVMRNLFQYGNAPAPPAPAKLPPLPPAPPPILTGRGGPPATAPPLGPPRPPPPPTAPPMTFKYYGYVISKTDGSKQAFLLDGDDIIVATENAPVKRGRYRVVAIGLTSITIEDTQFKSTQTLRIVEDAAG
jgi:hypothetical protein